jgi:hypothetical protein
MKKQQNQCEIELDHVFNSIYRLSNTTCDFESYNRILGKEMGGVTVLDLHGLLSIVEDCKSRLDQINRIIYHAQTLARQCTTKKGRKV